MAVIRGRKLDVTLPDRVDTGRRKAVDPRPAHLVAELAQHADIEKQREIDTFREDPEMTEISPGIFVHKDTVQAAKEMARAKKLAEENQEVTADKKKSRFRKFSKNR